MNTLLQDLHYALRQLRRSPGFTFTAVFTLALGLGASSAIFCLIDGLWLRPVHIPRQQQLVRIFATTSQDPEGYFNYSDYLAMAERTAAFKGPSAGMVAIGRRGSMMVNPDGTSKLLLTDVVSCDFFNVLGVRPLLGRTFAAEDANRLRTHPGVVLGYRFWQQEYAGDPRIVGRQIALRHGKSSVSQVDIWGVLPPQFREIDNDSDRDLWMSVESWAAIVTRGDTELTSKDFRWFNLLGRLAPGATVAQANDQVAAVAGALAAADPANNLGRGARAVSDFRYRMDSAGTSGLVLFAIVGGVVLLAIVNVAHLLLARGLARGPEVALRLSLGASRWAVARQFLIEYLLLSVLGWMTGLAIAAGIAALLPRLLTREPAMLNSFGPAASFQVDWRVFLFAGLLASVTMLVLALVPLAQVARLQLLPVLQAGAATRTAGRAPILRRAAVWLQIGISFALLVSTGALVRSFLNTRTQSIGLTRNQVLVAFTMEPDASTRDAAIARLSALPGAGRVAYGIRTPIMLSEDGIAAKALLPSHPEMRDPVEIKYNAVSPEFLSVVGTGVVRGRGFTAADDVNGPPVVLISQAMARKYWPSRDPLGQIVRLPGFSNGSDLEARIVGVAEDAPISHIGEIPEPYMYIPFHLSQMGEITFAMETRQNAMSVAEAARQALIRTDPVLNPIMETSLPELIRYSAGNYQMMAELVSVLGFIGLALTVVGLYGFLAFRVTQRRREIGIRMALGASREATAWLILRDTARMAGIGLAIGLALSLVAARLEAAVLFGVRPLDTLSLAGALCILALAVAAAAWLPARRAASIEPMQALRAE
ncbi:MAG TPA: ADOP family duplicated permease [Terracidiphilus sp.]|nr:ADOP family duplicated permease [Terracidiphilus sp.]